MSTLAIQGVELGVYVDGRFTRTMKVRRVEHAMGGQRLDSAEIYYDMTRKEIGDFLEEMSLFDQFNNREIEIVGPRGVIHWGKIAIVHPVLGRNGCSFSMVSRTEPHHFGLPIVGRWAHVQTAKGLQIARYDRPLVFNPLLDGKIVPNKSAFRGYNYFYFLDETASYTEEALTYQQETTADPKQLKAWTLADCVRYLCWTANEEQEFIKNPDNTQLDEQIEDPYGDLVKDFHIPDGVFLSEALDILLTPFGYQWQVVYLGKGSRQIFVQKKGRGTSVTVAYQPNGELLDLEKTWGSIDLRYDAVTNTASELTIYGGHEEVEATFELRRAWPEKYDETEEAKLQLDSDDYKNDPKLHRVWRDFVLDEAGDYVGVRVVHKKPYDLSTIFDEDDFIVRRRKFLPTLTLDEDGAPIGKTHGATVEFQTENNGPWRDIQEMDDAGSNPVILLEKEGGIRFNGLTPPWELIAAGRYGKVRITATLQSDKRLTRTAKVGGTSAQEYVPMALVMGGEFQKRTVHKTSIYYDKVKEGELESAEVNDTQKLQAFIARLSDSLDVAECSGTIQLVGLDWTFQLGQAVTGISGRNINLTTAAGKYPLIVGIVYDVPNQTTTLVLDAYRDEIERQLNLSRRPKRSREELHP